MKKIALVLGTRPEIIKLTSVVKELKDSTRFDPVVIYTNQHEELIEEAEDCFDPIYQDVKKISFDRMMPDQTPISLSQRIWDSLPGILRRNRFDLVTVQGDTTSAAVAADVAVNCNIPVAHVEAGIRSHNFSSPWPEEYNRCKIDSISSYLFAPTKNNVDNLQSVNGRVFRTGNTIIDAIEIVAPERRAIEDTVLITIHRRENIGAAAHIAESIKRLAEKEVKKQLVFVRHPNPAFKCMEQIFEDSEVTVLGSLSYEAFLNLLLNAYCVITDSGGVQEEAAYLSIPSIVLRGSLDRPESIDDIRSIQLQPQTKTLCEDMQKMLKKDMIALDKNMVYGQPGAGRRIVDRLKKVLLATHD